MSGTAEKSPGLQRTGLFRATAVVFAATVISALFGLLREVLIAREFGTTTLTDTYFFAFELVSSVSLVLLGGMAPALIAVYASCKSEGATSGNVFGSTVINVYVLGLAASALLFAVAAPLVGPLLASGFSPSEIDLVVKLLWCLTPILLLSSLALVLKALLEAEKLFFVSQISTSFLAIGVVLSVIFLAGTWGIYSLPIGMLIGTSIQVVWAAYWLGRSEFRYRPTIKLRGLEFKRFLSVLWPGIVGALIMGVMPLIDKSMASHMAAGTVACLTFASRPISMVARFGLYSLITALLPTFASLANEDGGERFRETVSQMLRILVFVTAPVGILLAALRVPIIEALFERGSFDAESTELTSQIFAALAFGLCPMALAIATSTIFASMQDTKTGAFIGGGSSLIAKVIFNLLLIAPLGAVGLAWSTSLQYVVSGILLLTCLQYRLEGLRMRDLISVASRVLIASAFAFFYVQWLVSVLDLPPLILCVVGMVSGSCVYLAFAGILRIEELHQIYYQFAESPALRRHLPTRIQRMLP